MLKITLAALLAIRAVAHSVDGVIDSHSQRVAFVYVHSCRGVLKGIYMDAGLTVSMPNPFIVDLNRGYTYYTETGFDSVTIDEAGHSPLIIRNCPMPKPSETPAR